MLSVKFLSFRSNPREAAALTPAPSIRDWDAISEVLNADTSERLEYDPNKLLGKTVKILTSYRAATLYTEGGLSFHRHAPKTLGANEYSGWPSPGMVEEVTLGDWIAEVEYVV